MRATRLTSELVDSTVLEDIQEEDGNIYLPPSKGYRNQYHRCRADQGYNTTPKANASLTISYVVDEVYTQTKISLWAYYFFWNRHYPDLRVSKQREDICNYYFRFADCQQ